jgi:hypothetical protein
MAKKPTTGVDTPAPAAIVLTCPFGQYDDAGLLRMWQPGVPITEPDDITFLMQAGAEHFIPE